MGRVEVPTSFWKLPEPCPLSGAAEIGETPPSGINTNYVFNIFNCIFNTNYVFNSVN